MHGNTLTKISLAAVTVAALLAGMLLAGAFDLTQHAAAERPAASPAPSWAPGPRADFADLAERVVPSVVSVFSTDVVSPEEQRGGQAMPMDPFEFFFGPGLRGPRQWRQEPMVQRSAGSGFFVTEDGELLTNNHVVEGADSIEIELSDRTRYPVEVVGRDPATDVALLKVVDADRRFPALALGSSKNLRVGEWVMAVGNPLNMDHTVTVGVVSAKGRVLGLADSAFENFIQTDAAINFGNSGGPLVNVRGEVVGMNTAISAGGQNLGFAVPIDIARRILPQLRENGKVVRGYLGAQVGDVGPGIQEAFRLPSRAGAFVQEVVPDHAAAKGGLEHGDLITSVNGEEISSTRELIDTVSALPPGSKVRLGILRDGTSRELTVVLEERPGPDEESAPVESETEDAFSRIGVVVRPLDDRLRHAFEVPDGIEGVVITRVNPVSPAGEEGLMPGDVITEANGGAVASPDQLTAAVDGVPDGGFLRLYVYRPHVDRSFFAILRVGR